jgi:hypothetical protein
MKATHSELVRDRRDGAAWRIAFRRTEDGIGVYNPTRRRLGIVAFMLVWLCGWGAGEWFALSQLLDSGTPLAANLFLLVWVSLWTVAGIVVLLIVLWQLVGVEKLFLIEGGGIVTERGFGPVTRRRIFRVDEVSEVSLAQQQPQSASASAITTAGAVQFLAGGKRHSFGIDLDEEEADRVATLMRDFLGRHQSDRAAPASGDGSGPSGDGAAQTAPG